MHRSRFSSKPRSKAKPRPIGSSLDKSVMDDIAPQNSIDLKQDSVGVILFAPVSSNPKDTEIDVLVHQRALDKTYGFSLTCPGGKVNHDETFWDAAVRKATEEAGASIGPFKDDAFVVENFTNSKGRRHVSIALEIPHDFVFKTPESIERLVEEFSPDASNHHKWASLKALLSFPALEDDHLISRGRNESKYFVHPGAKSSLEAFEQIQSRRELTRKKRDAKPLKEISLPPNTNQNEEVPIKACPDFAKGLCTKGEECKLSHADPPSSRFASTSPASAVATSASAAVSTASQDVAAPTSIAPSADAPIASSTSVADKKPASPVASSASADSPAAKKPASPTAAPAAPASANSPAAAKQTASPVAAPVAAQKPASPTAAPAAPASANSPAAAKQTASPVAAPVAAQKPASPVAASASTDSPAAKKAAAPVAAPDSSNAVAQKKGI